MLEGESLGKSRLDLEANLDEFRRNMREGKDLAGGMDDRLKALAAVANIAEHALGDVKMSSAAATESSLIADRIERSISGTGRAAMEASRHLEQVKLGAEQAAETDISGDAIDRKLGAITRAANEARRALESVKIAGLISGARNGVGVGPFGSGYGRIGVLGTAVAAGAAVAPAAGPAAAGLLATMPALAFGAAGAVGTLVLAFQGLGKAIGGDYKAFKGLNVQQQQFVQTIRSMDGWVDQLKSTISAAALPGLTAGLHAAFSPGTVQVLTAGLTAFARAIGQAGAAWGRYFGSRQFQQILGPLLVDGARNLRVISGAFLKLFDMFGVIGRAAIPLTNWLTDAAAKGAALADSWARAQTASGGLARGMQAAQQSLSMVWHLFTALLGVVAALGRALYPVSLIILPALTAGFQALAGWINRNRATIALFGSAIAKDVIAVVKDAVKAIGYLGGVIDRWFGPNGVRVAIVATAAAIGLFVAPWATVAAVAIVAAGEIIRHWSTVSRWFSDFGTFLVNVMSGAWTAIKGVFKLGVYYVLLDFDLLAKAAAKAFGWVPLIGPKIKHALNDVSAWIDDFRKQGIADMAKAGSEWGSAWGNAFATSLTDRVNAALDQATKHGGVVLRRGGLYVPPPTKKTKKPNDPAPGTHAWYMKYLGYDPTQTNVDTSVFGTPPPFTTNVPKPKKPKKPPAPPLLPPLASHALDLAAANANKAANDSNVGPQAERYLRLEITDLKTAATAIRDKWDHAAGKIRTELFHALTSTLNKLRDARSKLKAALVQDKLDRIQFAIDLAELAMASTAAGSAAYLKAEHHEEKLLRQEIAFYDKRVHNTKLSLKLREAALQSELAARQQLNGLLGQTSGPSVTGQNEALFLSTAQSIIHNYAPNFNASFPTPPTTAPLETKGYETVHELRGIKHLLERLVSHEKFPASGYATASAEAAFA